MKKKALLTLMIGTTINIESHAPRTIYDYLYSDHNKQQPSLEQECKQNPRLCEALAQEAVNHIDQLSKTKRGQEILATLIESNGVPADTFARGIEYNFHRLILFTKGREFLTTACRNSPQILKKLITQLNHYIKNNDAQEWEREIAQRFLAQLQTISPQN